MGNHFLYWTSRGFTHFFLSHHVWKNIDMWKNIEFFNSVFFLNYKNNFEIHMSSYHWSSVSLTYKGPQNSNLHTWYERQANSETHKLKLTWRDWRKGRSFQCLLTSARPEQKTLVVEIEKIMSTILLRGSHYLLQWMYRLNLFVKDIIKLTQ